MNKTFIVSQIFVEKEELIGNQNNIAIGVIVRKVKANSETEAIGKFVLYTKDIVYKQKLNVECVELKKLSEIK